MNKENMKIGMIAVLMVIALVPSIYPRGENENTWQKLDLDVYGILDVRGGYRTQTDPYEKEYSLAETRLQLGLERMGDIFNIVFRSDFIYDAVPDKYEIDLEKGSGPVDLREANVQFAPFQFMDLKIGRQILTWGTGDLVFINDMFPKDWQAFFIGRDVEYLKAPSDAVFASIFPGSLNIDLSYTPRFDPDRYISGERLSYWNPSMESLAGNNAIMNPHTPKKWFQDDEIAARISTNFKGYELAIYGYDGFWKNPQGFNQQTMKPYFPPLSVMGASAQGSVGKGLFNFETGYYHSRDDENGENPSIPNSQVRLLLAYEQELVKNLYMGLQYYLEHMSDYNEYISSLENQHDNSTQLDYVKDENRHVLTLRMTSQLMDQNLALSMFLYYSPSGQDAYIRPTAKYKMTDNIMVTIGANIFTGKYDHTFFNQFHLNSNVYVGARFSF